MKAGVFRAGNCADISLGLRIGTGDATDIVVCTAGVTFKLSGFGFGLDDDVLTGDLFLDKFSAVAESPELDIDDMLELEFEALIKFMLLLLLIMASEFLITTVTALSCSVSSFLIQQLAVACCADDLILAALYEAKCGKTCCPYSCANDSIFTLNGTFVSVFTISGNDTNLYMNFCPITFFMIFLS